MSLQIADTTSHTFPELVVDLRDPAPIALAPVVNTADGIYLHVVKPVIDRVVAAVLLVLLLPVLAAVAVAIRWSLGRGIFYRQERIGYAGTPFTVLKFRTMLPDRRAGRGPWTGEDRRCIHKTPSDPRHTRVGQFLRKWSLDELPQLVNVLRGEMSLVGPRPELPQIVECYEPWEHARHAVRPGLTGFWQTTARSEGPMQEFTHLDLEYVRSVSFLTDVRLLVATPIAALGAQKGC